MLWPARDAWTQLPHPGQGSLHPLLLDPQAKQEPRASQAAGPPGPPGHNPPEIPLSGHLASCLLGISYFGQIKLDGRRHRPPVLLGHDLLEIEPSHTQQSVSTISLPRYCNFRNISDLELNINLLRGGKLLSAGPVTHSWPRPTFSYRNHSYCNIFALELNTFQPGPAQQPLAKHQRTAHRSHHLFSLSQLPNIFRECQI